MIGTRKPKGWLSIARSQAMDTRAVLAPNGVRYMLDWVNDGLPYHIGMLEGLLDGLAARDGVWFATTGQIAEAAIRSSASRKA